ncbi:MAG TPA: hypothetical protein VH817_10260 [Thermoleophilaceae bacterium]
MRPVSLLICVLALGFAVAGCGGGSDQSADTTPAPPPLTVPGGETAPSIPDATTPTVPTTTTPDTGLAGGGTPSSGGTGGSGTVTPQAPSTAPSGGAQPPSGGTGGGGGGGTTTTPSSGGTAPGQFNQFCQENPGAC